MAALRRILREPLLHFLIAGAAIYLLFALWRPRVSDDAHRIVIDRAALLQYMQYQAKAFEPQAFAAQLAAMTVPQRRQLIDDYVREEVLYREARALGLERDDYEMRQRLVQKMGLLLEAGVRTQATEAELQQYLEAHRDLYRAAPSARVPALAEVRAQVQDDLQRDRDAALRERNTRALIDRYLVELRDFQQPVR